MPSPLPTPSSPRAPELATDRRGVLSSAWWIGLSLVLGLAWSAPILASDPATSTPATSEPATNAPANAPPASAPPASPHPLVFSVPLKSSIHPLVADWLERILKDADERNATAVILRLDTPGGSLPATRRITQLMMAAKTPVVVYVHPGGAQAASAGFFLLMAADVAAMAPGTNTGAAHPVGGGGEDIEGHLGEKVEQDSLALIRSLSSAHGRNLELAQAAVKESRSFTAQEALDQQLIEAMALDVSDLMRQIDGRKLVKNGTEWQLATASAILEEQEMTAIEAFLAAVAQPEVAGILLALGMLGLFAELSHPGMVFPGALGAICLIVGFYAMSVLPINHAGIALLALALVFFVLELITPTFGALALGGAISLILGLMMSFKDVDPSLRLRPLPWIAVFGVTLGLVALSFWKTLALRRQPSPTGQEGMIGQIGEVREALAPRGRILVRGELWWAEWAEAVTEPAPEPATADRVSPDRVSPDRVSPDRVHSDRVVVVAIEGLKLKVRPLGQSGA